MVSTKRCINITTSWALLQPRGGFGRCPGGCRDPVRSEGRVASASSQDWSWAFFYDKEIGQPCLQHDAQL